MGQPDWNGSSAPPNSTKPVNKFAFPSCSPLDFPGAGRRRSQSLVQADLARKARDERTLDRLRVQGLDGRGSAGDLTPIDLASQGALVGEARPPLRRWSVFEENTVREQREAAAAQQSLSVRVRG